MSEPTEDETQIMAISGEVLLVDSFQLIAGDTVPVDKDGSSGPSQVLVMASLEGSTNRSKGAIKKTYQLAFIVPHAFELSIQLAHACEAVLTEQQRAVPLYDEDELAYDGSSEPQRRELTPRERDIVCRAIRHEVERLKTPPVGNGLLPDFLWGINTTNEDTLEVLALRAASAALNPRED